MGIFGLLANNSIDYALALNCDYGSREWKTISARIYRQNNAINFYYYHSEGN